MQSRLEGQNKVSQSSRKEDPKEKNKLTMTQIIQYTLKLSNWMMKKWKRLNQVYKTWVSFMVCPIDK